MNTEQLLVVLPYCTKDIDLTRKLLNWIEKLSPRLGPHCCLLAADSLVPHETKVELGNIAKSIFYHAETAIISVPPTVTTWPQAPNSMFRITASHIQQCFKLPWFWMEPDAVPIRSSWLDELAVSYNRCPKRYMGALITANQPPMPPVHLTGCAIYPSDTSELLKIIEQCPDTAWDISTAPYTVPRAFGTPLIHHVWGETNLPPTFKAVKEPGDPVNTCTLEFIRKEASVFHRCKDGTLIDLLDKTRDSKATAPVDETAAAPPLAQGKRGPGRPRKTEPTPVTA